MGVEDDFEGSVHAIMDNKMDGHTTMYFSKDTDEVEWNILNFEKRNLVVGEYVGLICKLRILKILLRWTSQALLYPWNENKYVFLLLSFNFS